MFLVCFIFVYTYNVENKKKVVHPLSALAVNELKTQTCEKFWNCSKFTLQMSLILLSYQLVTLTSMLSVCLAKYQYYSCLRLVVLFKSLLTYVQHSNFSTKWNSWTCSKCSKKIDFMFLHMSLIGQPKTCPYLTQRWLYKGIMGI